MNIAFFGSPEISKEILESIHKTFPVSLVVTQPDKPVGRKQVLTPTPVKKFAVKNNITAESPETLKNFALKNIDLAIVVAYGIIFPQSVLDQSTHGFINVHYSLLPKYRGASPVQSALVNGDKETGVTIMKMDRQLDHGEIIYQKNLAIDENDTTESLLNKLTGLSKPLLEETIIHIQKNNSLPPLTPQEHEDATFCTRISKQDGFVEFKDIKRALSSSPKPYTLSPESLHNKIRAYYPWPNVWTTLPNGKRCKIISSSIGHPEFISGSVKNTTDKQMLKQVQHDNKLQITEIQIEGKRKIKDKKVISGIFQ